jgi:capsular exopolysaccharide synthesis family protein
MLLCLVAAIAGAVLTTRNTPKVYQASTTLLVNIPQASNPGEALQGVQLSTQLLGSYAQVVTSRSSAAAVVTQLGLPDSPDVIRGQLSASVVPSTLLLAISARDRDPVRAASIADAAAQVFISKVSTFEEGKRDKVSPSVIDTATVPATPISPRPKVNLLIGVFLGLLLAGALVLALEALDRSLNGPTQLAELAGAPILGIVPRLSPSARAPAAALENPHSAAAEAYRALRTAIRFIDPDSPLHTILVTSPGPNDGKSTIAANFAVAVAQSGERVVLIDADLRRGRLLDQFGLPEGGGVTSVVTGAANLDDVLQDWQQLLDVMGTGPFPPNPAELLGSQAMANLLDQLREVVDVVVIDAPPVLPVTDAVALSTQVDGVLLVARDGKSHRHSLSEARRRLDGVGANVIGCVLNAARSNADLYADYTYLAPMTPSTRSRIAARFRRSP